MRAAQSLATVPAKGPTFALSAATPEIMWAAILAVSENGAPFSIADAVQAAAVIPMGNVSCIVTAGAMDSYVRDHRNHGRAHSSAGGASRKLQVITGARGASVAMWNDKWRAARRKHGHTQEIADALVALDQVIEAGEEEPIVDRRPGEVWLYPAIFGRVRKVVIVKSEAGYMRLKSFMPYSPARAEKDRK